jgi:hypothetical protein
LQIPPPNLRASLHQFVEGASSSRGGDLASGGGGNQSDDVAACFAAAAAIRQFVDAGQRRRSHMTRADADGATSDAALEERWLRSLASLVQACRVRDARPLLLK